MSRNLHICSTYKVEYENTSIGSQAEDTFCYLLQAECPSYYRSDEGCGERIEVERDELKVLLTRMQNNPSEFQETLTLSDIGFEDLLLNLRKMIEQSDQSDSIVHLEFW